MLQRHMTPISSNGSFETRRCGHFLDFKLRSTRPPPQVCLLQSLGCSVSHFPCFSLVVHILAILSPRPACSGCFCWLLIHVLPRKLPGALHVCRRASSSCCRTRGALRRWCPSTVPPW